MFHHSKMFKESTEEEELCNMKVRNCDIAEGRVQSLRVNDEAVAAVSSLRLGDLTSNLCPLNFVKPVSIRTSNKYFLVHKVTQSSPSPALCFVEEMPQDAQNSQITAFSSGDGSTKTDNKSSSSKTIRDVHISMRLMEDFLDLAKENTEKDLETCGILGAFLEKGTLYMTTLIIPKQESASSSCQATNEEEVFTILNQRSLFPVGWIHVCLPTFFIPWLGSVQDFRTHPSQSCFMSSVDLHTQYSYQVMIPEAFAIVLAPTDNSRRRDFIHTRNQIMASPFMSTAPMCTRTPILGAKDINKDDDSGLIHWRLRRTQTYLAYTEGKTYVSHFPSSLYTSCNVSHAPTTTSFSPSPSLPQHFSPQRSSPFQHLSPAAGKTRKRPFRRCCFVAYVP
ncbi:hypothetical protein Lal_00015908 [Lupinus albus]|nr:hypothetical protein Lal_00015908 [Lupinus albus]